MISTFFIPLLGAIFFIGFFWFILSLLIKQVGRAFPLKYKTYRKTLPPALQTYRRKTGVLSTVRHNGFRLKGMLKVEVFDDGLLVSTFGRALWLPYTQHPFTVTSSLLFPRLSVEDIPVSPDSFWGPFEIFRHTTTLTVDLSAKACEEIMSLRERLIQNEKENR